jgi:hypothetical protein
VVTALLLWDRGSDDWLRLGILLMAWASLAVAFVQWLNRRARQRMTSSASAPRGSPVIAIPVPLQAPPPRAVRSDLVTRAIRHYRAAYPSLFVLPVLLGLGWFRHPQTRTFVFVLPLLALTTVMVLYVESNVRAVRRLLRDGSVVQGVVTRVSRWRKVPEATVSFSLANAPCRVSMPLDQDGDLELQTQVPILVAGGSSLVGMVTSGEEVLVGRMRRE